MRIVRILRNITSAPLNRDQPLRAVGRFLKWQLASRLAPGPVVVPWVGGTKFVASPGERGVTLNIYCGLHEFEDMAYVLHVMRPGDLFLDVGSNVGTYSLLACGAAGSDGIAFEPVPTTFERLQQNLRLNGLEGRVSARNNGLGETAGTLRFSTDRNCMNHVLAEHERDQPGIDVPVVRLDDVVADRAPTMAKIDVEGFETPVLAGAARVLAAPSLHSVLIELNGSGARYGYDEAAIVRKFHDHGFEAMKYEPLERRLTPLKELANRDGNSLFVRDLPRVEELLRTAPKFEVLGRSF